MQAKLLSAAYAVILNTSLVEMKAGESDVKGRESEVVNDKGSFICELVGVLEELRTP
jgi:hypothetical protein